MTATPAPSPAPFAARPSARVPEIPFARDLLRLVLYFDVFQHPLRRAELVRLVAPGRPAPVHRALDALAASGAVELRGDFVFRPGRAGGLPRRHQRARQAERLWPLARLSAGLLARLPWVRGVLVTGGLSKGSAVRGDDVDMMVLVEPGRVWTLKSAIHAARRTWAAPIRELLCTNYILSTDRLAIDDRNLFTAIELATAVPLHGPDACTDLLAHNDWARAFVPGLDWSVERAQAALPLAQGPVVHRVEAALSGPLGARVDAAALRAWDAFWERRYAWLDQGLRSQRFKRRPEVATNHLHDFQSYVLGEARQRLQAAGLDEPVELVRGHAPVPEAR